MSDTITELHSPPLPFSESEHMVTPADFLKQSEQQANARNKANLLWSGCRGLLATACFDFQYIHIIDHAQFSRPRPVLPWPITKPGSYTLRGVL
ncbi:hypothetical protein CEXT_534761 [Caerostris extrusa]|uniref:Uncharacterized protein n=1 Tax=Caerostris extrusa TaxID=172846 RepID=A0AAV4WSJ5_CAEEX|nr:hypothetical protein CEXT_534761 [Caerostris extrusa]